MANPTNIYSATKMLTTTAPWTRCSCVNIPCGNWVIALGVQFGSDVRWRNCSEKQKLVSKYRIHK